MSVPSGYEKLAVIGIAYKGEYSADTAYKTLNAVYYDGSTFVALRDSPAGPPAADGVNWMYMAKGFMEGVLSAINATDTSGLLGTAGAEVDAQMLMDALADRVMNRLLSDSQIVNNLLATAAGGVLDARQGKVLNDSKIAKSQIVNNLLATVAGNVLDATQGKVLNDKLASTDAWVKRLVPTSSIASTLPTPTKEETLFVSSNDGTFPYSFGLLEIRRGANYSEFTALFKTTGNNSRVYYNTYLNSAWTGWKQISDCLPLSGGTVSGSMTVTGTLHGKGTTKVAYLIPEVSGGNNIGTSSDYFNNIYSTTFTTLSSMKTKENIADIEEAEYEKLLNVRPVSFDYKESFVSGESRKNRRGFIAEEVYKEYPDFVDMGENGELCGVNYVAFIPEIIGLLQKHNRLIEELINKQ